MSEKRHTLLRLIKISVINSFIKYEVIIQPVMALTYKQLEAMGYCIPVPRHTF